MNILFFKGRVIQYTDRKTEEVTYSVDHADGKNELGPHSLALYQDYKIKDLSTDCMIDIQIRYSQLIYLMFIGPIKYTPPGILIRNIQRLIKKEHKKPYNKINWRQIFKHEFIYYDLEACLSDMKAVAKKMGIVF